MKRSRDRLRRDRDAALDDPVESDRPRPANDTQLGHLQELAGAVEIITPLQARIVGPTAHGPRVLRVVNPEAGHLTETIGCGIEEVSGQYWYSWHWTNGQCDTIGPADDPHGTAAAIAQVLRPQVGHA